MTAKRRQKGSTTAALAGRLALVAVLVMAAFAHRPAAPATGGMSLAELAQYVLPDGTLPDLCLPGGERHGASGHCEFCLIAGGAAPPCPAATPVAVAMAVSSVTQGEHAGPPVCAACRATAPARGPPITHV